MQNSFFALKSTKADGEIQINDFLTFDKLDLELKDQGIYYFSFECDNQVIEDWGRYNKATNEIITDIFIYNPSDIKIIGRLKNYLRDL